MTDVAVLHLVRASNGIGPLRRFLASYDENPGGLDHRLIVIFKGFDSDEQVKPYVELLGSRPYDAERCSDSGFDVDNFIRVALAGRHASYCFLNSHSILQDPEWLRKMHGHLSKDGVGLVGATGSYESLYDSLVRSRSHLGYEPVVREAVFGRPATWRDHVRRLITFRDLRFLTMFGPFPNAHLRTNGIVVMRQTLARIRIWPMKTKMDAYRFESGRNSLTRQVQRMGLTALIVGKDGEAYAPPEWPRSRTFRLGGQENLLVADNQTRSWLSIEPEARQLWARMAWGPATLSGSPPQG